MFHHPIHVFSEIGKLKKVLLHRPGNELNNLTPDLLDRLLFDDTPFLDVAQKEHDAFAQVLRDSGVGVVYFEDLVTESLVSDSIREQFVRQFLREAGVISPHKTDALIDLLLSLSPLSMVNYMIAGVLKSDLKGHKGVSLSSIAEDHYPFLCDPLPNLLFQRDPFASIGNGVSLHSMRNETRRRETLFSEYVFTHHPTYGGSNVPRWFERDSDACLEGGDILVLNATTLIIGISERTDASSLDILARNIFSGDNKIETIYALRIPSTRAFMHLDTVFTHIDHATFTIHSEIEAPLNIYKMVKDNHSDYGVKVTEEVQTLQRVLEECVGGSVNLIRCAGGHPIYSAREQWNDATNTLAIAPGEVVVYDRNVITNRLLEEAGIKIHVVASSELSRGRGGPRCMSMPLIREDI